MATNTWWMINTPPYQTDSALLTTTLWSITSALASKRPTGRRNPVQYQCPSVQMGRLRAVVTSSGEKQSAQWNSLINE